MYSRLVDLILCLLFLSLLQFNFFPTLLIGDYDIFHSNLPLIVLPIYEHRSLGFICKRKKDPCVERVQRVGRNVGLHRWTDFSTVTLNPSSMLTVVQERGRTSDITSSSTARTFFPYSTFTVSVGIGSKELLRRTSSQ